MDKLTLTVREAAGILGVSLPVAYELTERADFPVLRIGRRKIIPLDALKAWIVRESDNTAGR